jgi:hypothetical protein
MAQNGNPIRIEKTRSPGGRTAVAIRAPSAEHEGAAFEQNRVGLHHLCFRARERADVDELHGFLASIGTKIVRAPRGADVGLQSRMSFRLAEKRTPVTRRRRLLLTMPCGMIVAEQISEAAGNAA